MTLENKTGVARRFRSSALFDQRLMKLTPNDVITVESEDGILHEMVVKSQDLAAKTITGEVANWPGGKERGKVVETITVPDHCISWVGHRKLQ